MKGSDIKIIVCDDNEEFGRKLIKFVEDTAIKSSYYDDDFKFIYIQSPKKLLEYFSENDADILFLDISMPELDGFDVAKKLSEIERNVCLIFVSGFESNVFYSFRFNPFRFIRKSTYREEIPEALQSAILLLTKKKDCIILSKHNDKIVLRLSKIIYAEKEKRANYMAIHCLSDNYRFRGTVSDLYALVKDSSFQQISSNVIVNLAHVERIEDRYIFLSNGSSVKITTSTYQKQFLENYLKYMRME